MTRRILSLVIGASLATGLTLPGRADAPSTDAALAAHLLNRLGFGARPGDVERVMQQGALAYIDAQLHPERIDDAAMVARLAHFDTLRLSSREIAERYEAPLLNARRARKDASATDLDVPDQMPPPQDLTRARVQTPALRQGALPMLELSQQKILRAVYSERQLEEALVDFWFNHFNVDARKGPSRFLLTEYEREAIRPHVLGHFRDLLGATAKSPAMLFYLDNWMSADPSGPHLDRGRELPGGRAGSGRQPRDQFVRGRRGMPGQRRLSGDQNTVVARMPRGLNENYGRELLELHTLGVNGGYTQKDVTEVARAFTGWSIAQPRQGGGFRFAPALHDDGEKVVLGQTIKAGGGQRDGEAVLDLLAAHPATAHFISTKLAQRFVTDTPPAALIDRAAAEFTNTRGDLRAVMTVLLTSPEFLSPEAFTVKVKTPFDFIVSAVRATGANITDARRLVRTMEELGMPLYRCQPPTGYKESADAWVNTGALVNRMNVALSLASGKTPGVVLPAEVDAAALPGVRVNEITQSTIARATTPAQAMALALGAPEFQRR